MELNLKQMNLARIQTREKKHILVGEWIEYLKNVTHTSLHTLHLCLFAKKMDEKGK